MMEPLTLPCAGQVMQLSVQTEATSSLAAEQPEAVSPVATRIGKVQGQLGQCGRPWPSQ